MQRLRAVLGNECTLRREERDCLVEEHVKTGWLQRRHYLFDRPRYQKAWRYRSIMAPTT
jgi:hypothetical protein